MTSCTRSRLAGEPIPVLVDGLAGGNVLRASIDDALKGILLELGGRTLSPDEPAGMIAARIVDILHGGDGGQQLPEFLALVPLGRWLAEMVAIFGGDPVSEATQPSAAQLLGVLRGGDGIEESELDRRYPGDILMDVLAELQGTGPGVRPGRRILREKSP